jgi:predicted esterase
MQMACLILVVLALFAGPAVGQNAPFAAPALPTGTVIEKISCQGAPDQRYALYLPAGYKPDRAWPILYALDARGHGKEVAEVLKTGAERYGWIVASSYNTMSDQSIDPNVAALRAMWADTHARLAVDDRRIYLFGFSGTVRSAVNLALAAPGSVIGIFGAAAGFPHERPPAKDLPFDFFATFGDRDFNYYEMMDLEKKLAALAVPYRIEMFEGGHVWPPPELAARGMGWLELRAMKRGLREKDPKIVEALWAQDLEQARKAEAAGRIADAFHTWSAMKADYAGLRDAAEAGRKAAELGGSPALQREIAAREERLKRDVAYLSEAPRILGRAMSSVETPPTAARVAAELKLSEWKKRSESADVEESLSAKRVLNTLLVQTGYYLPLMLTERNDHDSAILMLSVAAEILPEEPETWVRLAAAHARKGKAGRKKALEALDKAVALGWTDRAWIDAEKAFDGLREEERFKEIVGRIAAGGGRG